MWSEHCSYKSSRLHLRRLPTEGPRVLVGPGENAGVIDAGDGIAVAIRIESHNHPSAIEPYQGAATGVGGILRDIFTMGARPLAVMDPLFFGPPDDARQRWLVEGVVSGISGYGNSVGVPTVGGELTFDPCYAQNPLVNVLCMGALPDRAPRARHRVGPGEPGRAARLDHRARRHRRGERPGLGRVQRRRGRDDTKRPSVQVGDPFEEKRLIEACLELLDTKLVVGIQDLGGAGLACATSETAGRGGVGMDVDVSAVPRREEGMEPWEVMTSESQERMLAIVTPESWPAVAAICAKWEVRATVIGTVTAPDPDGGGRLRIRDGHGRPGAGRRAGGLALRRRPALRPAAPGAGAPAAGRRRRRRRPRPTAPPTCWRCCARPRWVYRQYDHQLFLNTVAGPGARRRAAAPGRPGAAPVGARRRHHDRLQPAGLRARPAGGHRARPRRGCGQPGLRRRDARSPSSTASTSATPSTPRSCGSSPSASTGMAEACRRAVAAGDRGQRQPLQRERRVPTSTRRRCSACSASSTRCARSRPGWRGRTATPSCCSARAPPADGSFPLEGTRWATERRDHRTGSGSGVPAVDFAAHAALCAFVAGARRRSGGRDAVGGGRRWCAPCTTCRAAASPWPWPRWRPRRARAAR